MCTVEPAVDVVVVGGSAVSAGEQQLRADREHQPGRQRRRQQTQRQRVSSSHKIRQWHPNKSILSAHLLPPSKIATSVFVVDRDPRIICLCSVALSEREFVSFAVSLTGLMVAQRDRENHATARNHNASSCKWILIGPCFCNPALSSSFGVDTKI